MARYEDQVYDDVGRPVPGADVYIYAEDDSLEDLFNDAMNPIANPVETDEFGIFAFVSADGPHELEVHYGGELKYRQVFEVGPPVVGGPGPAGDVAKVLTRAELAAVPIVGQPTGLTRYLVEPGREGMFVWKAVNHTAHVTGDPYQGVYVAPASDATGLSGAWVRVIWDKTYRLSWWNPAQLGVNGHTVVNSAAASLPAGALFEWGANIVTVSDNVVFPLPVRIVGIDPSVSRIQADLANQAAVIANLGAYGFLLLRSSDSSVTRMGFTGIETNAFANNLACIHVQSAYDQFNPGTLAQRTLEHVEISDCEFKNTALAIVTATSVDTTPATNNGVIVVPSTHIKIHHNRIFTSQHGVEIFGSDYVDIHDNWIFPSPNGGAPQFRAPIRLLASREVDVHANAIQGHPDNYLAQKGILLSAASFGIAGSRRNNKNVRIFGNAGGGGIMQFVEIDECAGYCIVQGNRWVEDRLSAAFRTAIYISLPDTIDGLLPVADHVIVMNNHFEGVSMYWHFDSQGGQSKFLQSKGNTVIGNSWVVDRAGRIFESVYSAYKLAEFDGDNFLMNDGGGFGFSFHNGAGKTLRVVNCTLPEQASGSDILDTDGTGTFIKSVGNTGEVAALGANVRYPAGLWAGV